MFISYVSPDDELCKELHDHLAALRRAGVIDSWHDRLVQPGQERQREVDRAIESAQVILLLLSVDFIASDYVNDVEVRAAMARHMAGSARVIPILARPIDEAWRRLPFGRLEALPSGGRAVTSHPSRDEGWSEVVAGIRKILKKGPVESGAMAPLRIAPPAGVSHPARLRIVAAVAIVVCVVAIAWIVDKDLPGRVPAASRNESPDLSLQGESSPLTWATALIRRGDTLRRQTERASGPERDRLLADALDSYRLAQSVFHRDRLPEDWAAVENAIGDVLAELAEGSEEAKALRLLDEAIGAYRAVLEVRTREAAPREWTTTQVSLGNALALRGVRTAGEGGRSLLREAVNAGRAALKSVDRNADETLWSRAQSCLGRSLCRAFFRVLTVERNRTLRDLAEVVKEPLSVQSGKSIPLDWPVSRRGAVTFAFLERLAACGEEAARARYDDRDALMVTINIYSDALFNFERSYQLLSDWKAHNAGDFSLDADLAEAQIVTGRFNEGAEQCGRLRRGLDVPADIKFAVSVLEIVAFAASRQVEYIATHFKWLRELVAAQPRGFKSSWSFHGVRHFLARDQRVAPHRAWLIELLDAAEAGDRRSILQTIDRAIASFDRSGRSSTFRP